MTRRIRRSRDYELVLELKDDAFLQTPRESQRNWILNRLLKETGDELAHLAEISKAFVRGADAAAIGDRTQTDLADQEIMEDWQIPVMQAMVDGLGSAGKSVLELGFGRGVASTMIQKKKPSQHTIIECNASVIERFSQWNLSYPESDISIIHSLWQDAVASIGEFGGVFFHTYPLTNEDFAEQVLASSTFAEHFFDTAKSLLLPGGKFTYLTSELDSLSRAHQRALLQRFSSFTTRVVRGLDIPEDTGDATWGDSMVVVHATR